MRILDIYVVALGYVVTLCFCTCHAHYFCYQYSCRRHLEIENKYKLLKMVSTFYVKFLAFDVVENLGHVICLKWVYDSLSCETSLLSCIVLLIFLPISCSSQIPQKPLHLNPNPFPCCIYSLVSLAQTLAYDSLKCVFMCYKQKWSISF